MRAISSWASIPCMSSPYAFFTCEWTPTLTYMASCTYLFNSTAVTNQILSPVLPHPPLHRRDLPAPFGQDGCRCLYLYKENEMSNSNQKSGSLLPTWNEEETFWWYFEKGNFWRNTLTIIDLYLQQVNGYKFNIVLHVALTTEGNIDEKFQVGSKEPSFHLHRSSWENRVTLRHSNS